MKCSVPSRFSLTSVAPAGAAKPLRRRQGHFIPVEIDADDAVHEQLAAQHDRHRAADRLCDLAEVDRDHGGARQFQIAGLDGDVLEQFGILLSAGARAADLLAAGKADLLRKCLVERGDARPAVENHRRFDAIDAARQERCGCRDRVRTGWPPSRSATAVTVGVAIWGMATCAVSPAAAVNNNAPQCRFAYGFSFR